MAAHKMEKDIHQPHNWQRAEFEYMQRTQETSHQNTKKPIKKRDTELNSDFTKEEFKMAERH